MGRMGTPLHFGPRWLVALALGASAVFADAAALVPVHVIQGPGARSPLVGRRVVTEGAVTLVTSNGFFLQETDVADAGRASRGLFVFTADAPAVAARQCVR